MVVPHMVGGMKIGKWHGALAHGHEIFVAGHSGGGDTSKNERAMAPLKDFSVDRASPTNTKMQTY